MDEDESTGGGFSLWTFAEEHSGLLLGLLLVVILLLAYRYIKGQGQAANTTASTSSGLAGGDLSGLQKDSSGNPIVYVPTSTEFYTDNSISATSAPDAPASITNNSPVSTVTAPVTTTDTSTSTTTTTVGVQPPGVPVTPAPVVPPVRQPPVTPPPINHSGGLKWDSSYTVTGGESLARIASEITARVRGQGAPSSVSVSYAQIYAHNQQVIDRTAQAHGNPVKGGPENNIFPGEKIIVPRWVKG